MNWLGVRHRVERVPPWVVDASLTVAVGLATTIAIRAEPDFQGRRPDLIAYALGWTIAGLLLFRRRWPLAVLASSVVILQVYYQPGYPGIWPAVPLAGAAYAAAAAGHLRWSLLVAAWYVLTPLGFILLVYPGPVVPALDNVMRDAPLWLATLFLGDAVRSRRALAGEHRLLQAERAKSERLLRNVLPPAIAERLKARDEVIADAFPDVTVLFADIVNFTPYAERNPPEETVGLLNEVFSRFDALVESRGLEKIKTIGDAYMAAGGLPEPTPDHARRVAELALEMCDLVAGRRLSDGEPIQLRIGIDSGAVVAGVIGRRRFIYDLWGDTVNTASRMQSHGVPGSIQVTQRVRDLLHEHFVFQERGSIQVKGKGAMVTHLLVGRANRAASDDALLRVGRSTDAFPS